MFLTEATNDVRCLILQDTVHKTRVPRWCLHRLRRGDVREDELRLKYKSVGLLSVIFRIFSCYCRVSMRWSPVGRENVLHPSYVLIHKDEVSATGCRVCSILGKVSFFM